MLKETHDFETILLFTHNYKTSQSAHERLGYIIQRKFDKAMTINYGLQMLQSTILKIAITKENYWLLQPELKAIKDGLKYVDEYVDCKNLFSSRGYRGYLNAQGERQGVGMNRFDSNIGEWHKN